MDGHPKRPAARTVLVAEDDDAVRSFVCAALEQSGFAVVAAPDGRAALDLFTASPHHFALILTDVVMPHMIGPELVARARAVRPDVPVLFMSAFPGGPGIAPDPLPADEVLLEKPFSMAALNAAVSQVLTEALR
jgi:hypothetical protein